MKVSPARRIKVTAQRRNCDHESFEPHSDVYKNANDDHEPRRRAAPLDPEELWDRHVTGDHDPVSPPVAVSYTHLTLPTTPYV